MTNIGSGRRAAYDTELTWSQAAAAVSERLIALYRTMGITGERS